MTSELMLLLASSVGSSSRQRASLDYHYALDVCSMLASRLEVPTLICASSEFYVREFAKRFMSNAATIELAEEIRSTQGISVESIIWAEPDQSTAEDTLHALDAMLLSGGSLFVLTSQPLAMRLPEWRDVEKSPCAKPVGLQATRQMLSQLGYTFEKNHTFNSQRAVIWGRAQMLLRYFQLYHWADRANYQMRSLYASSNSDFGTVSVIVARKS